MAQFISNLLILSTIVNFSYGTELEIITREEWKARPARAHPRTKVIIAHTATSECLRMEYCIPKVQAIQNAHLDSKGYDDISYNFLIGGDGLVYEGRGWDKDGEHTPGHNQDSIGIAFIGNFDQKDPEFRQLQYAYLLLEEGVRSGKLSKDYKLYGHRQLMNTISPGSKLYNTIKEWEHWSSTA